MVRERDDVESESEESDEDVKSEDDEALYLGSLKQGNQGKNPLLIKLCLDTQVIEFEIDTGACVSVLSYMDYRRAFRRKPIMPFYESLKVVSGKRPMVEGYITVKVKSLSGEQLGKADIVIVKTNDNFRPLLGRDLMSTLFSDWRSAFQLNSIAPEQESFDPVKEFPKIFDENYAAEIKDVIADISIDKHANPIFHGPYTVPYGLREKVDIELERLVNCGILFPVKYSKWASPVVVVEKKNGSIRLSMDCRVTINKFVNANNYPLPLIEDILNEFPRCKFFFKNRFGWGFLPIES